MLRLTPGPPRGSRSHCPLPATQPLRLLTFHPLKKNRSCIFLIWIVLQNNLLKFIFKKEMLSSAAAVWLPQSAVCTGKAGKSLNSYSSTSISDNTPVYLFIASFARPLYSWLERELRVGGSHGLHGPSVRPGPGARSGCAGSICCTRHRILLRQLETHGLAACTAAPQA